MGSEMNTKPLEGIKVVEYATGLTVPSCGRILAYMGADVIKVEAPEGDPYRYAAARYIPDCPDSCKEAMFAAANDGKRFVVLDVANPPEAEALQKLVLSADIFLTDLTDAGAEQLGLGYETLKAAKASIIYASANGYGPAGPEKDRVWSDATAYYARGGYMIGYQQEGATPNNRIWGTGEVNTSMALEGAIAAALIKRDMTGEGSRVSSSLIQATSWIASMNYTMTPYGDAMAEPWHISKDDVYMYVQAISDKQIQLLLDCTGNTLTKEQYKRRRESLPKIREIYRSKTFDEWTAIFEPANIPFEKIRKIKETAEDQQGFDNAFLFRHTAEDGTKTTVPMPPVSYEGSPEFNGDCRLGKDTEAVLSEI